MERIFQASGYEIQYSTSGTFASYKTVQVTSGKTVQKVLKKLTKGKNYYVRIRSIKKVSGKKYVSAWSMVKRLKITK